MLTWVSPTRSGILNLFFVDVLGWDVNLWKMYAKFCVSVFVSGERDHSFCEMIKVI